MKKKTIIFLIMGISLICFLNLFSVTKNDSNKNSPLFKYSLQESIKRLENTTPENNDNMATLYGGKCVNPMSDTTETVDAQTCGDTYQLTCGSYPFPTCQPTCQGAFWNTCDYTCANTCNIATWGCQGPDSTCIGHNRLSSKDLVEFYY